MPMVYTLSLATAGNTTTNGSANTENETFTSKPGVRNASLQAMYVTGKGAGLTAISGIIHRIVTFGTATASGGGVAVVPSPKDPGMQAALQTVFSGPTTPGSTRKNHVIFGSGAAGPGGWVAPNPDSVILLQGGSAGSIDAINASGTLSLAFEWSAEVTE